MRGYGQYCPVAKAAEVFAERWTPLVLRELLCGGRRFNELHRGVPLMSRSLLTRRLRELEAVGIVERRRGAGEDGWAYGLSPAGEALRPIVEQLGEWARRWGQAAIGSDDLDTGFLMWGLRRSVDVDAVPGGRCVVRFDFRGVRPRDRRRATWWLVVKPTDVDVCQQDPGLDVDLWVHADLGALTRILVHQLPLRDALRTGLITIEGPRDLVRVFPRCIGLDGDGGARAPLVVAPPPWSRPAATAGPA